MTAKIKNWDKFQHYKSGRGAPPWIKLYRELLNDKEWFALDPVAAKFMVSLWILCAETDGELPDSETLAFRLRLDSKTVENCISLCSHWIISDASNVLAGRYQLATPETETETDAASSDAPSEVPTKPEETSDEADLFRRGKQILGPASGGLISKLLKAKGGSIPKARAAIERASEKHDPREYIGRVVRGPQQERHSISDPLAGII